MVTEIDNEAVYNEWRKAFLYRHGEIANNPEAIEAEIERIEQLLNETTSPDTLILTTLQFLRRYLTEGRHLGNF